MMEKWRVVELWFVVGLLAFGSVSSFGNCIESGSTITLEADVSGYDCYFEEGQTSGTKVEPTVSWSATSGTFPNGNSGSSVQWTAPTVTSDTNVTITATASSPLQSASANKIVTVCLPCPTGENTYSNGWFDGGIHQWRQRITPYTGDYAGLWVIEFNANDNIGSDSCWFAGSIFSPMVSITGGIWVVESDNWRGDDYDGWYGSAVVYYRTEGRAPCLFALYQRMDFLTFYDTCEGYKNNILQGAIGSLSVASERDGVSVSRTWP